MRFEKAREVGVQTTELRLGAVLGAVVRSVEVEGWGFRRRYVECEGEKDESE